MNASINDSVFSVGNISFSNFCQPHNLTNVSHPQNVTKLSIDDVLHLTIKPVINVGIYVHLVWYIVGFVGNVISAVIWNKSYMYQVCSSAHYLVTISICDLVCQILHVFYYMEFFWWYEPFSKPELCEFWSIMYMIPLYISEMLVLGFTAEKLISLRNPFRSGWFSGHQRAPKEIVWIVISVTVFAFPLAYFWKVDNMGYCDHDRLNENLENPEWIWLSELFIYFAIPVTVTVLNSMIIKRARHSIISVIPKHQLRKDVHVKITERLRESTKVLLTLSYFRVFTLLPTSVVSKFRFLDYFNPAKLPAVYSIDDEALCSDRWQRFVIYSGIYLGLGMITASRLALSFVIYCCVSIHFRREFFRLFMFVGYVSRKTIARKL